MKKKAKPEGCVHPDCFHCRLPDCKYSKTETSDSEYLVRMNRFRNFQTSCFGGNVREAQKAYPECVDNCSGVIFGKKEEETDEQ